MSTNCLTAVFFKFLFVNLKAPAEKAPPNTVPKPKPAAVLKAVCFKSNSFCILLL
jgi:hypothetical protein